MVFIYDISIRFYSLGIKLAALTGNEKARKWIKGRKDVFEYISASLKPGEKRVWFHCASLGEFEQGRPVMEKLSRLYREQNAECKIVLTFFSPSGYEIRKNYAGADYIFYLPLDNRSNAKKFIELVNPEKAFFVKYEYWYHYFTELKRRKTPLYIVSAIFRKEQSFFKWYGGFFRRILKSATHFFVQDEASQKLLQTIGLTNVTVSGDTRFDRVFMIASEAKGIPLIEKFKNDKKLFIAGSTWLQDDDIVLQLIESKPGKIEKYIIAPHEIGTERIQSLYEKLTALLSKNKVLLFSKANESNVSEASVIIVDNIGMLSSLYRYADIALIGGGFGKGIHNTLEAAVFGMPLFFGPNYHKFKEAVDLIHAGAAFPVNNFNEFRLKLKEFENDEQGWRKVSEAAFQYVNQKKGATEIVLKFIR